MIVQSIIALALMLTLTRTQSGKPLNENQEIDARNAKRCVVFKFKCIFFAPQSVSSKYLRIIIL